MTLNFYGYEEQVLFVPKRYDNYQVKVSKEDKVLVIKEDGSLLAKIGVEFDVRTHKLSLIGKDDNVCIDDVVMPVAFKSVNNIEYDKGNGEIKILFNNTDGSLSEVVLDIDEVVKSYKAGRGIEIDDDNVINVKVKDGDTHLVSSEEGLSVTLSDFYTKEEIDEKSSEVSSALNFLNETKLDVSAYTPTDLSDYYTKEEIDESALVISTALIDLEDRKLDVSAYTPSDLSNYYTKSEVDEKIEEHEPDLSDYYTKEEIDDISLVTSAALNNLNDIKLDVSAYTPTDLSDYYTKEEINEFADNIYSKEYIDSLVDELREGLLDPTEKQTFMDTSEYVLSANSEVSRLLLQDGTIVDLPNIIRNIQQGRTYNVYDDDSHRNMNNNLSPGIYLHCRSGRPSPEQGNHGDEIYTLISKPEFNNNTMLYNVQQWAYSENYPNQAFYRIVKTPALDNYDSGNYGTWVRFAQYIDLSSFCTTSEAQSMIAAVESEIPSLDGYATENYVNSAAQAISELMVTKDQEQEDMSSLENSLKTYIDEKDVEVKNESKLYTDEQELITRDNLNELSTKFTKLTDGISATSSDYTGGTGVFDHLYKEFHDLIKGLDENRLPTIKSLIERIEKLENVEHNEVYIQLPQNVEDYYFQFFTKESADELVWGTYADRDTVHYQTPLSISDSNIASQLWTLEKNSLGGYTIRNAACIDYVVCAPNVWDVLVRVNGYTSENEKANYSFEYYYGSRYSYWVVKNIYYGNDPSFIGLWDFDKVFADGERLAGNREAPSSRKESADKIGIRAILKADINI